jgi:hypothetical protein
MDEESWEVFTHYYDAKLTNLIYNALIGSRTFFSAAVVGSPGIGKTSYMYYSLKAALIRALCHGDHVNSDPEECIKYIESNYGELCFNRYCAKPDPIDEKYRFIYYTGVEDLKRFLSDARELLNHPEVLGRRRLVLFLDDLVSKSAYQLGGEMRELYTAFKEVYRLIRLASGVVLMTAIHRNYFPDEVLANSEFIIARLGYDEVLFERWTYARFYKHWFGDGFYFKALKPLWEDKIPKRAIFGLPEWLEKEINERKIYTLKSVLDRVLGKKEHKGKKARKKEASSEVGRDE